MPSRSTKRVGYCPFGPPCQFDVKRPLVIGHRGLPEVALENTRCSFELAIQVGSDTVETAVHLASDGHVVCTP
ncbi:glycerophosphodiester phosphodiesterase [Bradyrhizobium sp. CIR48]|uniref:glycerophosphodiester phosphodiesterase n=1 Tax=Bradyrhizobium sp. CIR48 TaxID=2663840 RepID=UPI003908904A